MADSSSTPGEPLPTEHSAGEDAPNPSMEEFTTFLKRRREGSKQSFEDYCRLRPQLADELRKLHADWRRMSDLYERLGGSSPLSEQLRRAYGEEVDPAISLGPDLSSEDSTHIMRRLGAHGRNQRGYESRGLVARGGMGAILRVWDEDLRRTLAMKVVLGRDEEIGDEGPPKVADNQLSRFLEEAQITGQLDHPGIVPVHDLGIGEDGRVFFTMPLVRGKDLKQIFDHVHAGEEGWTESRALGVMVKVCEAMAYAHSKGVIHRDLKPANVMVGRFGETYVMDWGLAKVMGREETQEVRRQVDVNSAISIVNTDRRDKAKSNPDSPLITLDGDVVGTPAYMAPEQAQGRSQDIGPAADVYAVGAMLYHLFTGNIPYNVEGAKISPQTVLSRAIDGPPKPIEEQTKAVPIELVAICEKAMERAIGERYDNMLELAEDLRAFLEGKVVRAYEQGALAEFRKWVTRNKIAASGIASSVLIALGGLGIFAWQQSESKAAQEELNSQLRSNQSDLERSNEEMTAARDRAMVNQNLAETARLEADAQAQLARHQSYVANLRAADLSLNLDRAGEAKQRLSVCEEELRGFEWHHLALRADPQALLMRHREGVTSIDLLPNGSLLSASKDSTVREWDLTSGEPLAIYRLAEGYSLQAWGAVGTEDGTRILGHTVPNRLWLWDAGNQELLRSVAAHSSWLITDLAIRPGDEHFVTSGIDKQILLWDFKGLELEGRAGTPIAPLSDSEIPSCLAWSPDGTTLATGFQDSVIRIWPMGADKLKTELVGHSGAVKSLAYDPAGKLLASASEDASARIWNVETEETIVILAGHRRALNCVAFNADSTRLATGSDDSTVRVWDVSSGRQIQVMRGCEGPVRDVCFTVGGEEVIGASEDGSIRLWSLSNDTTTTDIPDHPGLATSLDFHPNGKQLASASSDSSVRLWNLRTRRRVAELKGHGKGVTAVQYSPDGKHLASSSRDRSVIVWDTETGQSLLKFLEHEREVRDVAWRPDGKQLASCGSRGDVYLFDPFSGGDVALLAGHKGSIHALDYSADGKRLATAGSDKTARIWNLENDQSLILSGHERPVYDVAFSSDNRFVATASADGLAILWDAATGELLYRFDQHVDDVLALCFDRDSRRLVTVAQNGTISIIDLFTRESLLVLDENEAYSGIVFSRDGKRLASSLANASEPGNSTIRVWETEHYE